MADTSGKIQQDEDIETIEIQLLLEAMVQRYGYDFRDYAMASLKRRIQVAMQEEGVKSISRYQDGILHNPDVMSRFLNIVSVGVTALFRDPTFYKVFRQKIAPTLHDLPLIRVWHSGCSSGEEVYSMTIVLYEEGLLNKTLIYATDINQRMLNQAKEGVFSIKNMKDNTANYHKSGGKSDFSEYYTAKHDRVILRPSLSKNIIWAQHNLVSDSFFNEFNIVLCRNVMIYFNRKLQDRTHQLLYNSLTMGGFLVLGHGESLTFSPYENCYKVIDTQEKIYRRVR
jgi:chemotaxis protein methyltransferase CheR